MGATASLSVAAFETDRIRLNDIRLQGTAAARIKSLELRYVFDAFPSGRILSIEATDLHFAQGDLRADVQRVTGDGSFTLGIGGIRSLRTDLDVLRAALGGEPIYPSRLTMAYGDEDLSFETTIPSARGHIALFGKGKLSKDAAPFQVTVSGRLDPALLPFMQPVSVSREAVSFSVNAEVSNFLTALAALRKGDGTLPSRFSADGELALDLGRISIAGKALGASGRDRIRFRLENITTNGATTRGSVAVDVDIGPRQGQVVDFARANVTLRADVHRNGDTLAIGIRAGSNGRVFDLRGQEGLRLDGETAVSMTNPDNRITIDLNRQTARHRLQAKITRRDSQLRLQSEGDLSVPDDPVVFTLQGKVDPAPLLALIPDVAADSGFGEIFIAGEATGLLAPRTATKVNPAPDGMLRIDGAATLNLNGLAIAGTKKLDTSPDKVTMTLKAFKATRTWRQGNIALSARLGPRRIDATTLTSTALSIDGQLRSTDAGYRLRLTPGGAVNLGEVRSPLLTLRNRLRLELAGNKNTLDMDRRLRPYSAQLRFEEFDTLGALTKRSGHRTPFRLRLRSLVAALGKDGLKWRGEDGTLTLPELAIAAQGVSLSGNMTGAGISAELKANDVRHRVRRPLTSPVRLSAKADIHAGTVSAQIRARQFSSPLTVDATLTHDYRKNSGHLRISTPRFTLHGPRHRFGDMFPIAIGWFDSIRGTASANAEWNWDSDIMSGQATLAVRGVDLAMQDVRISGMNGAVNFIELSPLLMPPRQRLTGTLSFADLGPLPFRAEFQLNEDGSIAMQDLDIDVAGGRTRTRGVLTIGESGVTAQGKVEATSIALRNAFHILGIDGIEGTGRISGVLPITLRNNAVQIKAGHLTADAPGRLRYAKGTLEDQMIGTAQQKASAIKALSDFRFQLLDVALDNTFSGTGSLRLQLRGTNPSVYDGSEFSMEMQVISDLRRLERLVLGGFQTAPDVSRQADTEKRSRP